MRSPMRNAWCNPGRNLLLAVVVMSFSGALSVGALPAEGAENTASGEEAVAPSSGPIIRWNMERSRFEGVTAEQRAKLVSEFKQAIEARFAGEGRPMPRPGEVRTKTLANGLTSARVPMDQLNFSLVRVGANGQLEPMCADDWSQAHGALVGQSVRKEPVER